MNVSTRRIFFTPDIIWRRTRDSIFLLNLETHYFYAFNAVGSRLLEMISSGRSEGQLTKMLAQSYRIAPDRAFRDIDRFRRRLEKAGLIWYREPPDAGPPPRWNHAGRGFSRYHAPLIKRRNKLTALAAAFRPF